MPQTILTLTDEAQSLVFGDYLYGNSKRYELGAAVVMKSIVTSVNRRREE